MVGGLLHVLVGGLLHVLVGGLLGTMNPAKCVSVTTCSVGACRQLNFAMPPQNTQQNAEDVVLTRAQVEEELRELLAAMDAQKAASAAKMKQLASVLQDLQVPFMSSPLR